MPKDPTTCFMAAHIAAIAADQLDEHIGVDVTDTIEDLYIPGDRADSAQFHLVMVTGQRFMVTITEIPT
jgi:hypothetical protein